MPFPPSEVQDRILRAFRENRLAHAYLLSGSDLETLEACFHSIASQLIGTSDPTHPDLHIIRPESKSRRLRIEQIRALEHALQLHAHDAPIKVAAIVSADRMCLPPAEAANAFLKTLEEPPPHSVIFLLTDRPGALLPTIQSRCLTLTIQSPNTSAEEPASDTVWARSWLPSSKTTADTAFRQAKDLLSRWTKLREKVTQAAKKSPLSEDDDVRTAQIESDFLLARDQAIASLIRDVWKVAQQDENLPTAIPVCEALEQLRYALSRNIDPDLAVERACLVIFRQILDFNDRAKIR